MDGIERAGAAAYRFGDFVLLPSRRRLLRNGEAVALGSRALDLIIALVERAGQLVTKDELILQLWGPLRVEENSLHAQVSTLRRVIGRGSIATKQSRGYIFTTPVVRSAAADISEPDDPAVTAEPRGFIGRGAELAAIAGLFGRTRLVTLTGPGGVGKTRLALHALSALSDLDEEEARFIDLAGLRDPALLAASVGAALGVEVPATATAEDVLVRAFSVRRRLVVLDNCEHLAPDIGRLAEILLAGAPNLRILATSRKPLGCADELVLRVPPLPLIAGEEARPEILRRNPAVALFLNVAQAADTGFTVGDGDLAVAAEICRRLDGLPLAIEIVASRAPQLGLEALHTQLFQRIGSWPRSRAASAPHQRTLLAAFEWSYALLSPVEQATLRRLSIFAGSFPLAAATLVAASERDEAADVPELLAALVRDSLLIVDKSADLVRYRLLETTRSFARCQLDAAGEDAATLRRLAMALDGVLDQAASDWETMSDARWRACYAWTIEDLRALLSVGAAERVDAELIGTVAGRSWPLWRELSQDAEGLQRLGAALEALGSDVPPQVEARLRLGLGLMWLHRDAARAALVECRRAADLFELTGDPRSRAQALTGIGLCLGYLGETEAGLASVVEAQRAFEATGSTRSLALAYSALAMIERSRGEFAAAGAAGKIAGSLFDLIGADRLALSERVNNLDMAVQMGRLDQAVQEARAVAEAAGASSSRYTLGNLLGNLAGALTMRGDLDEAADLARKAAPLLQEGGMLFWLFDYLVLHAALSGRHDDAAALLGHADASYHLAGQERQPNEEAARSRALSLMASQLGRSDIERTGRYGAALSAEQALRLAFRG